MLKSKCWKGPITEDAITRAEAGFWIGKIDVETSVEARIAIIKSALDGPYLIVAGPTSCNTDLEIMMQFKDILKSGALIVIELGDQPALVLDHDALQGIMDAVDEAIVVSENSADDWTPRPRMRFVPVASLLSEALQSMCELGIVDSDTAARLLRRRPSGVKHADRGAIA